MFKSAANPALWRQRLPLLALILIMVVGVGCQSVAPVIKIGLVAPFEGRHRAVGYDVLYSARLAVREINAAGGIGGTRVALVALDDGGNREYAEATAKSLLIDPAVMAVVGHWLPETTATAAPLYSENGLAFLAGGRAPYDASDPAGLSDDFVAAYQEVTPFDEEPGPYAESAYNAFQTLFQAFADARAVDRQITRSSVRRALSGMD